MTLRWAARILFVVAIVVITDLALQPGIAFHAPLLGSDKLEHFAAFVTLTLLARIACPGIPRWVSGLVLLVYGGGIEWLQDIGTNGRTASFADLVADMIGIVCGLVVAWWVGRTAPH